MIVIDFIKRLLKKIRFSLTDYQTGVIIDRTSYKAMSNWEVAKTNFWDKEKK